MASALVVSPSNGDNVANPNKHDDIQHASTQTVDPAPPAILYRAQPGLRMTVEGADGRRHTYDDAGRELGNDVTTGVYDTIEIEDMTFDVGTSTYTYPCPCGDTFALTVDDMMNGETIARCPSCTLIIKVIYDPKDVFEESVSDDDADY